MQSAGCFVQCDVEDACMNSCSVPILAAFQGLTSQGKGNGADDSSRDWADVDVRFLNGIPDAGNGEGSAGDCAFHSPRWSCHGGGFEYGSS